MSQELHDVALRSENSDKLDKLVRKAINDEFAVTDAWKTKSTIKFVINCPSGQRCLAKHLTTMDLLEADLMEEMDFFSKQLFPVGLDDSGNPIEREEKGVDTIWTVLRDPKKKCRFLSLLNRLLAVGIIKPKVIDDGVELEVKDGKNVVVSGRNFKRELGPNEVLASAIDFEDKMAIFGELNKPLTEIKPFRVQQKTSMASMAASESPTVSSKRDIRHSKRTS